jgi:hypothetical protein
MRLARTSIIKTECPVNSWPVHRCMVYFYKLPGKQNISVHAYENTAEDHLETDSDQESQDLHAYL